MSAGRLLSAPVGLALDDEFVRGGGEPIHADWASSGSAIMASHSSAVPVGCDHRGRPCGGVPRPVRRSRPSRSRPAACRAKSSMISSWTWARRRISASTVLSSRAALRRLNSLSARGMSTLTRRRTAMCPSAVARWVLPTPTGPRTRPRAGRRGTAGWSARSTVAGRSAPPRWRPRSPGACRGPGRRRGRVAAAELVSRRVTSSASTSSRKSAWARCCWRASASRSGRVSSILPSLSCAQHLLESPLTGSLSAGCSVWWSSRRFLPRRRGCRRGARVAAGARRGVLARVAGEPRRRLAAAGRGGGAGVFSVALSSIEAILVTDTTSSSSARPQAVSTGPPP